MNLYWFCSEGTSEIIKCFQQGFVSGPIFLVSDLLRVNCVYEFARISPQS